MIRLMHFFRVLTFEALQKAGRGQVVLGVIILFAVLGSTFLLFEARESSFFVNLRSDVGSGSRNSAQRGASSYRSPSNHPIDDLINDARLGFTQLLGKRSLALEQAASRYRERRGRHPPPGFDKWYEAATAKKAIIIEDFFDQIYHDINPFWGLEPYEIRKRAHGQAFGIEVRNGTAKAVHDDKEPHFRQEQWLKHIQEMMPHLPDIDIFVNHMDESRVLVPWEDIAKLVEAEEQKRKIILPTEAITTYSGVADVQNSQRYDPNWLHGDAHKFWDHVRDACPPDSPGRAVSSLPDFNVTIDYPSAPRPEYTYKGYIRNFTASQDPCLQPHLRGMHGTFIEAISMSTTHQLMPIFGECKLPQNNEILIPSAMYLAEDVRKDYGGGGVKGRPWSEKKNGVIWRGAASGARNKEGTWWHNHRHRFVQMMNGTTISAMENGDEDAGPTFRLLPPESKEYDLPARKEGTLGKWVSMWSNVSFNTMICEPPDLGPDGKRLKTCKHTDKYLSVAPGMPFEKFYDWKYLPDVDGNSFSGRYRAFLQSTSMPLKATIYTEWHDARLMPWVHFVPFDNSYMDIYGIMEYFLDGRDEVAERIANEGQAWADAVLRKDDMLLYTWRLLLEYARVIDDNRERLAFVEDLLGAEKKTLG